MATVDSSPLAGRVRPLDTPHYHAIPPAPRHAISTHFPGWELILEFSKRQPEFFARFCDMYPRFLLHRDIKQLIGEILKYAKTDGQFCLPFPTPAVAEACQTYVTASPRTDTLEAIPSAEVTVRTYALGDLHITCVFFPITKIPLVMPFWSNAGVGISSRLAEDALKNLDTLREVTEADIPPYVEDESGWLQALRERIVELMERAPVEPQRPAKVSSEDVYLYQTGMAAIYYVHNILLGLRESVSKTVMFGFPFHQTIHIFKNWGPGLEFLPLGTEYDALEQYLESQASAGTPVAAVWTEFPSNPLLVSSDLLRLRQLADKYRFALVVDETISGFCNVDVLGVADIVVTSLTKAFSGYADVMGGSAVLNPNTPLFSTLKPLFNQYSDDLYPSDAATLLRNNDDYLPRSLTLNTNAATLVSYLHSLTSDPNSAVTRVYYPTVSPTLPNYDAFMRPATPEFTPGYGCLFSVEFVSVDATIAFYDNLFVHQGPHLGAHRTLALPYVKLLFGGPEELEKVRGYGLDETQVRISVGLEEVGELMEVFRYAVGKADEVVVR